MAVRKTQKKAPVYVHPLDEANELAVEALSAFEGAKVGLLQSNVILNDFAADQRSHIQKAQADLDQALAARDQNAVVYDKIVALVG